jgi:hypothetical protein
LVHEGILCRFEGAAQQSDVRSGSKGEELNLSKTGPFFRHERTSTSPATTSPSGQKGTSLVLTAQSVHRRPSLPIRS